MNEGIKFIEFFFPLPNSTSKICLSRESKECSLHNLCSKAPKCNLQVVTEWALDENSRNLEPEIWHMRDFKVYVYYTQRKWKKKKNQLYLGRMRRVSEVKSKTNDSNMKQRAKWNGFNERFVASIRVQYSLKISLKWAFSCAFLFVTNHIDLYANPRRHETSINLFIFSDFRLSTKRKKRRIEIL